MLNHTIITANMDTILAPAQPNDKPHLCDDGFWGPHEYSQPLDRSSPYLAWIPSLKAYADPAFQQYTKLDPTLARLNFEDHPLIPVTLDAPSTSSLESTSTTIPGLPAKPKVSQPSKANLHHLYGVSDSLRDTVKA
jgi:hypothetical protein